jgi:cytochrome b561
MIVALGHAAMALFHQYVLKDGLLRRMMRAE